MEAPRTFALIRSFKRHYHKLRKAAPSLVSNPQFTVEGRATPTGIESRLTDPNPEETTYFVSLMGRFLRCGQDLFYEDVWRALRQAWSDQLPEATVSNINDLVARFSDQRVTFLSINIDDEDMSPRRIYDTVAEGEFFREDPDYSQFFQSWTRIPVFGHLLLSQFYSFNVAGYMLMSAVFDVIKMIEETDLYKAQVQSACINSKCIYCLSTTGPFASEEHIFPEALGNDELVLPPGYVCSTCNNTVLSGLDEALVNYPPVAMLRVQFVPHTKSGRFPEAKIGAVSMKRTSPRHISIKSQGKRGFLIEQEHLGDEGVRLSFSHTWRWTRRLRPEMVSRAVHKIALGLFALDFGADAASDSKFDPVRRFVLGQAPATPNQMLIRTQITPVAQGGARYFDQLPGTIFVIDIFGIWFVVNLEAQPPLDVNEQMREAGLSVFPPVD